MYNLVDVLGVYGDDKPHYNEEAYEIIRYSLGVNSWSLPRIHKKVRKYIEYGLILRVPDSVFKGHYKFKISDKGLKALDFYRNQHYKDPEKGVLF